MAFGLEYRGLEDDTEAVIDAPQSGIGASDEPYEGKTGTVLFVDELALRDG